MFFPFQKLVTEYNYCVCVCVYVLYTYVLTNIKSKVSDATIDSLVNIFYYFPFQNCAIFIQNQKGKRNIEKPKVSIPNKDSSDLVCQTFLSSTQPSMPAILNERSSIILLTQLFLFFLLPGLWMIRSLPNFLSPYC